MAAPHSKPQQTMATTLAAPMRTTLPLGNGNSGSAPSFTTETVNDHKEDSDVDEDGDADDLNEQTKRKYLKGSFYKASM